MRTPISDLIRSNIALALLCVISIGVLALVVQQRREAGMKPVAVSPSTSPQVISTVPEIPNTANVTSGIEAAQSDQSESPASSVPTTAVADPNWASLPAPDTFPSFVYSGQETIGESLQCTDTYAVVLLYPVTTDYRVNHGGFIYNQAFPCTKGVDFDQAIDLKDLRLAASSTYYEIRANQSSTGTWYNPY